MCVGVGGGGGGADEVLSRGIIVVSKTRTFISHLLQNSVSIPYNFGIDRSNVFSLLPLSPSVGCRQKKVYQRCLEFKFFQSKLVLSNLECLQVRLLYGLDTGT